MTIALVNSASGGDNSGVGDATVATGAFSLSAGNLLVVTVRGTQSGGSWPPTISDTAGNAFTFINTAVEDATNNVSLFYAKNTIANASNVVTATFNGWSFCLIACTQYSGVDTVSPLDVTAIGNAGSQGSQVSSVTSGTFTTTVANELVVAGANVAYNSGGVFTGGTGYTVEVTDVAAQNLGIEDQIVSSILTGATVTMSYNKTGAWGICVATFKGAVQSIATIPGSLQQGQMTPRWQNWSAIAY